MIFDSDGGRDEGKDYSRWNDVARTLRGDYGARASRKDPDDPLSLILYVAAPIRIAGKTAGVLTVAKPAESVSTFLDTAQHEITLGGIIAVLAVVLLGAAVSYWVSRPIERLTRYAQSIRDGKRAVLPRLGRGELGNLGAAFEEMRIALEGKAYVENYVQTLTHQMKTPVSAIRGAAELLKEDMPEEERKRFIENIHSESQRMQELIDHMLRLSAVENRRELRDLEDVDMVELVEDALKSLGPVLTAKGLRLTRPTGPPVPVRGERFLLLQAITNLIQNAADFSPEGSSIEIALSREEDELRLTVRDHGPGIPDFAVEKVFDRFYSLPRPGSSRKSTGLGLPFVREVAHLHGGWAGLSNPPEGGACATFCVPAGERGNQ